MTRSDILQSLASKKVADTWVSSDNAKILEIAEHYGAKTILRPDRISGDYASSESAWLHSLAEIEKNSQTDIDYILAPQVTSPLRDPTDFSSAIAVLHDNKVDSLLSVAEVEDFFVWGKGDDCSIESINYDYKNRQLRQQIEKRYLENGSFYIFKPSILKEQRNRLGGKIVPYIMERHKMFQIDNQSDIEMCEVIMRGYGMDKL